MTAVRRACWGAIHLGWSVLAWLVLSATRRGAALVFTHHRDLDRDGRDRQLGPLVDRLAADPRGVVEVCYVPVGTDLLRALSIKRRPMVSYAALVAVARAFAPRARGHAERVAARVRVATWLLRSLRPRVVYLIDESASGQPLLRAARSLGIRTVGVQHGDFRDGDPVYDRRTTALPADAMCVWSEWFRSRLLAISPIYAESNTRVTGRLRASEVDVVPPASSGRRCALVLADDGQRFAVAAAPFLDALSRDGFDVVVRPHPAGGTPAAKPLHEQLVGCDVAIGHASSALLEALRCERPVIVLALDGVADPRRLVADGLATSCSQPSELAAACRAACELGAEARSVLRRRVWGEDGDALGAVLAAAEP